MSIEIEHLGLKDSAGCGINRDLQVCMEPIRLGYFHLGGLVCVQYKRREAIFLDSVSKYLLTVRNLYP
jgi:hypothetical protein